MSNALLDDESRREKNRLKARKHREHNRDSINAAYRERYAVDPSPRLTIHKKYRERNREAFLARRRELYALNRENELAKAKEYRGCIP